MGAEGRNADQAAPVRADAPVDQGADTRSQPTPEKPTQSAAQVSATAHQSLLDEVAHFALDPVVGLVTSNRDTQQHVVDGAKALAKTVPLFMSGPIGRIALGLAYSSDEVKTSDTALEGIQDAFLGLSKGAALSLTRDIAVARNVSPTLMGIELGVVNRAAETGLTRDNYTDDKGNFSLMAGLEHTAVTTLNPVSLATDAAIFGAADVVWGKVLAESHGAAIYSPTFTHALAGGVFGASSGLGTEIADQLRAGQFDAGALVWSATSQGTLGLIGGGVGGLQTGRRLSLGLNETAADVAAARSTPFQKGEIVDASQKVLRDGKFTLDFERQGAHDIKFLFGRVESESGTAIPAVFRVDNGSEYFNTRKQTEIAMYGLDQRLPLDGGMPTTVARTVDLNGETLPGFIQEMRGQTLRHYLGDAVTDGNITRAAARQAYVDRPELVPAFKAAFIKRELLQQWDNHSLNFMVDTKSGITPDRSMFSIDWDTLRAARSTLDFQPLPAHRFGWDNIATRLYSRIAGQPIPEESRSVLQSFHTDYSTPEGRADLRSLGFTDGQIDGIIGRAKWFVDNGILPRGMETPGFHTLWPYVKALKQMIRPKQASEPLILPPAS